MNLYMFSFSFHCNSIDSISIIPLVLSILEGFRNCYGVLRFLSHSRSCQGQEWGFVKWDQWTLQINFLEVWRWRQFETCAYFDIESWIFISLTFEVSLRWRLWESISWIWSKPVLMKSSWKQLQTSARGSAKCSEILWVFIPCKIKNSRMSNGEKWCITRFIIKLLIQINSRGRKFTKAKSYKSFDVKLWIKN